METNNPYTSPQSNLFGGNADTGGDGVSQGVMLQLKKTKPWVRFFSVMMFIGAAFMLIGAIAIGVLGASGVMKQSGATPALGAGFGVGFAAIYGVLSVVYIFPALKLWKYADRIRDLCSSMQVMDLEKALNEQRAFWKFVGVMMIMVFAIYFVVIIVAVGVGVGAAVKSGAHL